MPGPAGQLAAVTQVAVEAEGGIGFKLAKAFVGNQGQPYSGKTGLLQYLHCCFSSC